MSNDLRALDSADTYALRPGSGNYRAYVGPPQQYDVMGATQFALLLYLGLRERHRVLDFGCGSLRLGRLLLPYLLEGGYSAVEPNAWLIDDAVERCVGADQMRLRRPVISATSDFTLKDFATPFDFIIAQSIFSHAGRDVIEPTLKEFRRALAPAGLVVATFILPEQLGQPEFDGGGWVYPGCVAFREESVAAMFSTAGLAHLKLAWRHPRQTWFVAALSEEALAPARAVSQETGFRF